MQVKLRKWLVLLVVILVLMATWGAAGGLVFARTGDDNPGYDTDQILVQFRPGLTRAKQLNLHEKHGGRLLEDIQGLDVQLIAVPKGRVQEKVKEYLAEADVQFAEPDYIAYAAYIPSDPYFGQQWNMVKIAAPGAWNIVRGTPQVKVAICDTGIDQDHEDLPNVVASRNFSSSPTADDNFGHGTHVAGICAAVTDNGLGVAGAGFGCSLMNVKVLGDDGSGRYSSIAKGIVWAANNGARVINLSIGSSQKSKLLQLAIDYAWKKGCVIVCAAGNDGTSTPYYPAAFDNCIAVGATDQSDERTYFSNYGSWVDVAAPGWEIFSTMPNHPSLAPELNYGVAAGTSMASPHVAGVAALVWARHPLWTNIQVRKKLLEAVDPAEGFDSSIGRIDAYKAVK